MYPTIPYKLQVTEYFRHHHYRYPIPEDQSSNSGPKLAILF